jgi:MFS family permease
MSDDENKETNSAAATSPNQENDCQVVMAPTSRDDNNKKSGGDGHDGAAIEARAPSPLPRPGDFGERPACFKSTTQEVAFIFMATMAVATNPFFVGGASIITASIGQDLGMTQGQITWITASTALTSGAFQLGLGQLTDLLGRKITFIAGMGSFSAFSLLVAFAKNAFWMDIVCGVVGVASAMAVPPAIGIMGAAYSRPSKRKNLAFSAFSAGNPREQLLQTPLWFNDAQLFSLDTHNKPLADELAVGFVFGTILCGVATRLFNWRASFILLAILWAIFTVMAIFAIPRVEAYDMGQPLRARLKTFWSIFDSVGTVLTIFGTGLVTAAVTYASFFC